MQQSPAETNTPRELRFAVQMNVQTAVDAAKMLKDEFLLYLLAMVIIHVAEISSENEHSQ